VVVVAVVSSVVGAIITFVVMIGVLINTGVGGGGCAYVGGVTVTRSSSVASSEIVSELI
jgi:hypothetical protein